MKKLLSNFSANLLIGVKNLVNHEEIPESWRSEVNNHFREINKRLKKHKTWDEEAPRPEVYKGMIWIRDHYDILKNVSANNPSKEVAEAIREAAELIGVTPETIRNYLYTYQRFQKGERDSIEEKGYLKALARIQEEEKEEEEFNDMFDTPNLD